MKGLNIAILRWAGGEFGASCLGIAALFLWRGVAILSTQSGAGGGGRSGMCSPRLMRRGRGVSGDGALSRADVKEGYFGSGIRNGGR